ncbi:MAG: hypothetical protein OHK0029_25740 [Armatimonadaceae bacterium]
MPQESPDKFERVRLTIAGTGVTVISWFDSKLQLWRANAPALLWLLGDREENQITGTTREKALQSIQNRLTDQISPARFPDGEQGHGVPISYRPAPIASAYDAQGRLYSESDRDQLCLLGVLRVYLIEVSNTHPSDTARLMFGECYLPAEPVRRVGVAFLSRQALETALWEHRLDTLRLLTERVALLQRLRFDMKQPHDVLYDAERSLYVFQYSITTPVVEPPQRG